VAVLQLLKLTLGLCQDKETSCERGRGVARESYGNSIDNVKWPVMTQRVLIALGETVLAVQLHLHPSKVTK